MNYHRFVLLSGLLSMFVVWGCEDPSGQWQQVQPWSLALYVAVDPQNPHIDDLDAILADFNNGGPECAPDHVQWLPLHNVEYWLDEARTTVNRGDELTADDLPKYFEQMRSLIVRPQDRRMYLLVHTVPPNEPGHVEPVETMTVERAQLGVDSLGRLSVDVRIDTQSGEWLHAVTRHHLRDNFVFVVEGEVYGALMIQSELRRELQFGGLLPEDEVRQLSHGLMGRLWIPDDDDEMEPED